jgi:hypothetical protein
VSQNNLGTALVCTNQDFRENSVPPPNQGVTLPVRYDRNTQYRRFGYARVSTSARGAARRATPHRSPGTWARDCRTSALNLPDHRPAPPARSADEGPCRRRRCPVRFSATPARRSLETLVTPGRSESFEFENL